SLISAFFTVATLFFLLTFPFFFLELPRPPKSPLFPYTTLFRSRDPRNGLFPEIPKSHEGTTMKKQIDLSGKAHLLRSALNLFFRSEEHTSELQSQSNLVCRLLLEKKKKKKKTIFTYKAKQR